MSEKIDDIYRRYLKGTLTRVELDLLLRYFEQASKADLDKLVESGFNRPTEIFADHNIDERLQRVQSHIIDHTFRRPVRPLWKQTWAAVAASILVVFSCYYYFQEQPLLVEDIAAPSPVLFVKNTKGDQVDIAGQEGKTWRSGNMQLSLVDSQTIRLSQALDVPAVPELQTLYTERSDFKVILEDGSVVTLNARSAITLGVPFNEDERVVSLIGEGFFEVAHDAKRPFKVEVGSTRIAVLGTQFNVRAYPESKDVETVLTQGKIALWQVGNPEQVVLAPGEKAISDKDGIRLAKTRTEQVTAWKDRYFMYENEPLADVLQDVARWYGADLDTTDMPPDNRIYMKINKNLPLSEVLQLLHETSSIRYKFEKGKISIQ